MCAYTCVPTVCSLYLCVCLHLSIYLLYVCVMCGLCKCVCVNVFGVLQFVSLCVQAGIYVCADEFCELRTLGIEAHGKLIM